MITIKFDSKNVKMIAHKGLCCIEVENTCPGFVAAGNRNYYGIETDVRMTKDKKFFISHDASTDRLTGNKYCRVIEETTSDELENILLADSDGSFDRQDLRIPFLPEYIRICKKYEKKCVLDVKTILDKEGISFLVAEFDALGYTDNVIFLIPDMASAIELRKALPNSEIELLFGNVKFTDEMIKSMSENKFDVDVYYKCVTAEMVEKLHQNGIKINCWTCDDVNEAEELVKLGVDYITTDVLESL